jgi:hypothetical protein
MSSATYGSQENPRIMSAGNIAMPNFDSAGMPAFSTGEYPRSDNDDFSQAEMAIEPRSGDIEPPGHLFSIGDFEFDSMGFMDLSQYVPSTGMDWIFCNSIPGTSIPLPSFLTPIYFGTDAPAAESSDYQQSHEKSDSVAQLAEQAHPLSRFYIDANGDPSQQLSPFSIDLNGSSPTEPSSDIPHNNCEPDDPWPMEWYATSLYNSELPFLGNPQDEEIDGSSFFGMIPVTDATRESLKDATRLPSRNPMWPEINLDKFPSKRKLDHCIDLYFAHFHRVSLKNCTFIKLEFRLTFSQDVADHSPSHFRCYQTPSSNHARCRVYRCLLYWARRCKELFKFVIGTQSATSPLYGMYQVVRNLYCPILT